MAYEFFGMASREEVNIGTKPRSLTIGLNDRSTMTRRKLGQGPHRPWRYCQSPVFSLIGPSSLLRSARRHFSDNLPGRGTWSNWGAPEVRIQSRLIRLARQEESGHDIQRMSVRMRGEAPMVNDVAVV